MHNSQDKHGRNLKRGHHKKRREHNKDKRRKHSASKTSSKIPIADVALPPSEVTVATAVVEPSGPISLDELVEEDVLVVSQTIHPESDDDDDGSNEGGSTSNLLDPSSSKSYSLVGSRRRPGVSRYGS